MGISNQWLADIIDNVDPSLSVQRQWITVYQPEENILSVTHYATFKLNTMRTVYYITLMSYFGIIIELIFSVVIVPLWW